MNLLALIGSVLFAGMSAVGTLQPEQPYNTLTAPTQYDYRTYNFNTTIGWVNRANFGGNVSEVMDWSRTGSGPYNFYSEQVGDGEYLPKGMTERITITSYTGTYNYNGTYYWLTSDDIGSTTASSISSKVGLEFVNSGVYDYRIHVDLSASGGSRTYSYQYSSVSSGLSMVDLETTTATHTSLDVLVVPAGTSLTYYNSATSSAVLLTAIYYEQLQTSTAISNNDDDDFYDAGLADGFDKELDGFTLLNGFESVVGIVLNVFFVVLGVEILGISLLDIFAVVFAVVGVIWILKLIRG